MNVYLKIKDIKGNSKVDTYEGMIVLDSLGLSVDLPMSNDYGNSERTLGRPEAGALHCQKETDQASPAIMAACFGAKKLGQVELIVSRNADDKSLNRMVFKFENCIISSYSVNGAGNGSESDSFAISYTGLKFEYTQQGPTGEKVGSAAAGWDLANNKPM